MIQNHNILARLEQYYLLTRMNKPIGTLLLLWPTICALWIAADGFPGWPLLLIFLLGTFLMRSAGCAINDYADRDIDLLVKRTKDRPLTSGKISSKEALMVAGLMAFIAFCLLYWTNTLTVQLSFVALILAAFYPFSKRFTQLPQVVLGAAFAWGIPMAYAAVGTPQTITTWVMYSSAVLWALAYDTMYAMVDREDDLKIGVKSAAILFGDNDVLIISLIQAVVILLWLVVGYLESMSMIYYVGVALASMLVVYQILLIRDRETEKCFKAFLNNNYLGLVIFVGVLIHYA